VKRRGEGPCKHPSTHRLGSILLIGPSGKTACAKRSNGSAARRCGGSAIDVTHQYFCTTSRTVPPRRRGGPPQHTALTDRNVAVYESGLSLNRRFHTGSQTFRVCSASRARAARNEHDRLWRHLCRTRPGRKLGSQKLPHIQ